MRCPGNMKTKRLFFVATILAAAVAHGVELENEDGVTGPTARGWQQRIVDWMESIGF